MRLLIGHLWTLATPPTDGASSHLISSSSWLRHVQFIRRVDSKNFLQTSQLILKSELFFF